MQNQETKKIKLVRKLALILVAAGLITGLGFIIATKSQNDIKTLTIHDTKLNIEIATSSQEKQRGLCCRESLPSNQAMLFVYDSPGNHRFWMKDTKIPLDMYFINSNKKIIYIERSVQPSSYPKTFGPESESQYVLETNAGFAKKHNINTGDIVNF